MTATALETFIVAIIGGFSAAIISHLFSMASDRRLRNRKIFDDVYSEIEAKIGSLVALAASVWGAEGGKKKEDTQEIICQIHDISTMMAFLEAKGAKLALRANMPYANFRRAVTEDDFDVRGRPANLLKVVQIRSHAIEFKIALRDVQYEANRLW